MEPKTFTQSAWEFIMFPFVMLAYVLVQLIAFTAPRNYLVEFQIARLSEEAMEELERALEELEDDE